MKYIIFALCILFLVVDAIFEINPIFKNIIYGIMTVFAVVFLYMNKAENGLDNMFKNDNQDNNTEKKSLLNLKNFFKK